jgi:hypothetical protein
MKRSAMLINFLICAIILAGSNIAYAQLRLRDPSLCGKADYVDNDLSGEEQTEKRKAAREKLEMLLMWKLSEKLDLSEETGAAFFPIMQKYNQAQKKIIAQQKDIRKELGMALKKGNDEKLEGLLSELRNTVKEAVSLRDSEYEELKAVLSMRQLTKYLLFRERFNREIHDIVFESRQKKHQGNGHRHGPDFDEDDYSN